MQINSNLTFNSLLAKNPSKAFKSIRNSKKGNSKNITSLTVGKIKYKGVRVKDGFFDSLSALKNPPHTPSFGDYDLDYKIILWLASSQPVPLIPIQTTDKILLSLKKHVHNFYNVYSNVLQKFHRVRNFDHHSHWRSQEVTDGQKLFSVEAWNSNAQSFIKINTQGDHNLLVLYMLMITNDISYR